MSLDLLHFALFKEVRGDFENFGFRPEDWIYRRKSPEQIIRNATTFFDRRGHGTFACQFWYHNNEWIENARIWTSLRAAFRVDRRDRKDYTLVHISFWTNKNISIIWRAASRRNQSQNWRFELDRRQHRPIDWDFEYVFESWVHRVEVPEKDIVHP